MEPHDNDPWALRAALAGDAVAWTYLVEEFSGTIWGWARSHGLNREDAEDVSQTVWFLLKDKGHRIDDPRRLAGWLATVTRREAIAVAKRRTRQRTRPFNDEAIEEQTSSPATDPQHATVTRDLEQRLVDAFAELSHRCRELLALLWDEQLSYREIAELLETSVGSIGPTRQRCLRSLRLKAAIT